MAERPYLVGYPDRLSVRPGERVEIMAAADGPSRADAALVRLGTGDATGDVRETVVAELGSVEVDCRRTQTGSFMVVPGASRSWPPGPFVAACLVMPTRLGHRQSLLTQSSTAGEWSLHLDDAGRAAARATGEAGTAPRSSALAVTVEPLVAGAWYLLAAGFDPEEGLVVVSRPLVETASWRTARDSSVVADDGRAVGRLGIDGLLEAPLVVAAASLPGAGEAYESTYDGKLERPQLLWGRLDDELIDRLVAGTSVADRSVVGWDFAARLTAADTRGRSVPAVGEPGCDGTLWNTPGDAVTGHCWDGSEQDWRLAPAQYGALHFHADDLDDCRWPPTVGVELASDLGSGMYALRLRDERGPVDRVPFFVRASSPVAPLLFLVPTASYLAYANDHPVSDGSFSEATAAQVPVMYEDDVLLHQHREWGLSMYDSHLDGSGVGVSSARRPLLNMRPTHRYHIGAWQLPADLAIVSWLDDQGIAYEVATDEDLHGEGVDLLAPYRAVVTASHPEYYSTAMLDGMERYLSGGGRLAYLGANGFYWRVAFDPERPWIMELRRGQSGSRAWESAPGEGHFAFTGERGGLWRHLGRSPQRLTGVGYAAQGFDRSGWYVRLPDSDDPRASFIFEGVDERTFGQLGEVGGGAVGQEIDRYDRSLGTAHDALLLATSQGLTEGYRRCVEEVLFTVPGTSALLDPKVRGDMVFHVKSGGGAVFAVGSLAWAGSLRADRAVGRITRNVLDRFVDPEPLSW